MGWAMHAIAALKRGETTIIKPRGRSMEPRVHDGQEVTIEPVTFEDLCVDDVILCTIHGRDYLHLIKAIDRSRVLIGNNRGGTNGWIGVGSVHGKAKL